MFACPLVRTTRRRLLICLVLLTGLLAAGAGVFPAAGQLSDTADASTNQGVDVNRRAVPAERKSPSRALLYSLTGTVGGTIVLTPVAGAGILLGPVVGPSLGHFYSGAEERAWQGIRFRSGGMLVGGTALLIDVGNNTEDELSFAGLVATMSFLSVVVSGVYDIVKAPQSAHEYNENRRTNVRVTPTGNPRSGQVGLRVTVPL